MGYRQSQRGKVDELRERYRKRRRKQLAAATGIALIIVAAFILIFSLVLAVRSCSSRDSAISVDQLRETATGGNLPSTIAKYKLPIAPWLVAVGEKSMILAGDTGKLEPSYPNYPVNYLALYDYGQQSPAWSVDLDTTLTDLRISGECAVTFNQSMTDPPFVELDAYKLTNGISAWSMEVKGARSGQLDSDLNVLCLTYLLPDGYRIVGINGTTGTKAWGRKIDLGRSEADLVFGTPVYIHASNGYAAYFRDSVFGLVKSGTGEEIRWFDFGGTILDYAIDVESESIFVILEVGQTSYLVKHLPFRNGIPLELYTFSTDEGNTGSIVLSCTGNRALLAFRPEGQPNGFRLVGLEAGAVNPIFEANQSQGTVNDLVDLTHGSNDYLVAVNQHEATVQPRGWGKVFSASFESGGINEIGQFNSPVMWFASIDSGCLALLHGGRVLAFAAEISEMVELDRMSFPGVKPVWSNSGGQLAILSYPAGYRLDEPGSEMKILVLD